MTIHCSIKTECNPQTDSDCRVHQYLFRGTQHPSPGVLSWLKFGPSLQVKGGGHASNPGFSSTKGVLIAMSRFSNVTLSLDKSIVEVGAGLVWDDVYSALDGTGVNIVGGRVPGV